MCRRLYDQKKYPYYPTTLLFRISADSINRRDCFILTFTIGLTPDTKDRGPVVLDDRADLMQQLGQAWVKDAEFTKPLAVDVVANVIVADGGIAEQTTQVCAL